MVVCACVLNELIEVNDSKTYSEARRTEVFDYVMTKVRDFELVYVSPVVIDEVGLWFAWDVAVRDAIDRLRERVGCLPVIVDGSRITDEVQAISSMVGGDKSVKAIAAASVIAKVMRDTEMIDMSNKYPNYGFNKHKGYGVKDHIEAIQRLGPCKIHRMSFLTNIIKQHVP